MGKPLRSIILVLLSWSLVALCVSIIRAASPETSWLRRPALTRMSVSLTCSIDSSLPSPDSLFALPGGDLLCTPAPNIISWTTATEMNTAGFNLYRAERADGPYAKINAELIPAASDPLGGSQYEFNDPDVTPGRMFYYQLEEVELGGKTTRHGPIIIVARASWLCENLSVLVLLAAVLVLVLAGGAVWTRRAGAVRRGT